MYSNFEVIRLIQQDSNYHVISDYVTGKALGIHIIRQVNIEKEHFFAWMMQILNQIDFVISARNILSDGKDSPPNGKNTPYCRQITPYHIILKSDNTVALLNTETKVNQKYLSKVSEYPVIKKFQPDIETDNYFYSFGKTLQFLLAKSNLSPELTYGEERKLQKIISKCLTENPRKQYRSFADIASDFPTHQQKQNKRKSKRKFVKRFIGLAGALALVFSWGLAFYLGSTKNMDNEAYYELGLSYFVMADYEKSLEMFVKAGNSKNLEYYRETAAYMYGTSQYTDAEMERILRKLAEDKNEFRPEEKSCLIRVYNKIDTNYAREQVIKLGKEIVEDSEWSENKNEIREILASVYQREGQYEEALQQYEELLKNQYGEELYKTTIELYQKCGKQEEALQLCADGIFHNEKSTSLEVAYISLICKDKTFTEEEKEEKIASVIGMHTELLEEERFRNLQIQYGIMVEGENVWLEN